MTLDIKVFSKSLTIDTHYARSPTAFPVNISGASQQITIKDIGGPNTNSANIKKTSISVTSSDNNKSHTVKNNDFLIYVNPATHSSDATANINYINDNRWISKTPQNNNEVIGSYSTSFFVNNEVVDGYASVSSDYNGVNWVSTSLPTGNTPVGYNSISLYITNEVQTDYATVSTNYSGTQITGDYTTSTNNFPTGTRTIVTTLKNLSSDSADTTAPTVDETEIFEFPVFTSLQNTEYSHNIEKIYLTSTINRSITVYNKTYKNINISASALIEEHSDNITKTQIVSNINPTTKTYLKASKDIDISNTILSNSYSDNITKKQIISTQSVDITSYIDSSSTIFISDSQSPYLKSNISKKQIISQTDKGAVSKTKSDAATISMFIKNEADVAYFDLNGYASFKQVTPFNDPIPPSDSTTETGGGTGGGTTTTTGPIQSWSS